ncbi:PilZ domain-containing protein [Vibrio sp. SCSIO 43137]|uniref:PilZ domain-containing protein n=1 Tax=Vibrio sp. SCSIO 43137 TaxID=3021011 RepID=UPI00230825E5|nr:PilZ domain-containing protein [Vibrio sp. SCSIO 43137]WCE28626.1 PilZ domain-containing protein [Vibrio sp. SCSIO 43137]
MDQQEFFTVHHKLTVNVEPLAADFVLPEQNIFVSEIPAPFIVASEFSQVDTLAERAMSELKNSDFKHLIQLIDHQNGKLNLLLTFMLAQQDDESIRSITTRFGASQFTYIAPKQLEVGQLARVKLFLDHPPAAIYCYAKVVECAEGEQGFEATLTYSLLREQDQDLLIKAALYQQQKLLRQRSKERENQ